MFVFFFLSLFSIVFIIFTPLLLVYLFVYLLQQQEDVWFQESDNPNFALSIADFGESKIYETELEGYTIRNRGTEYNKSPEMLNVAYASQKTRANYDRRKRVGANIANDMWSLGCVLYELLTGEFLFFDNDWIHFFFRVTDKNQQVIREGKRGG